MDRGTRARAAVLTLVLGLAAALAFPVLVSGTDYSGDLASGCTASAQSEWNGSWVAGNAVDGNAGTSWASVDYQVPSWWQCDFGLGASHKIAKVTIRTAATEVPRAVTISGKVDGGSSFDTLWSNELTNVQTTQTVTFSNATGYRYIKVSVDSVYAGVVGKLTEVGLFEDVTPTPTPTPTATPTGSVEPLPSGLIEAINAGTGATRDVRSSVDALFAVMLAVGAVSGFSLGLLALSSLGWHR